ncbi:MAG: hypothetical protein JRF63_15865 [Deltaproteobacteria bacterium]|nr:hypothetical protein [Deltaproteobacteria bacterium]
MIHCSVAVAATLTLLTAAEFVVSIVQGYEMFKVQPFSGLMSGLFRMLEPAGPVVRRTLAVTLLGGWVLASLLLSVRLFQRREF